MMIHLLHMKKVFVIIMMIMMRHQLPPTNLQMLEDTREVFKLLTRYDSSDYVLLNDGEEPEIFVQYLEDEH